MIAVLNRDTSGNLTSKSTQTKEDVVDIEVDSAVGLKTDDDIYLTPNEKKRARQKKYRLRKSMSDEFKQRERDRKNKYYSSQDNSDKKKRKMRQRYAHSDNCYQKKKLMQQYYTKEANIHNQRERECESIL